jgi:hypothetical protein
MEKLQEIGLKYGTDKAGGPLILFYEKLFADHSPERVRKVLEIGIGHPGCMGEGYKPGASLRMWEEYFPNADIFALDVMPEILINEGRIHSFLCDQGSPESLAGVIPHLGNGFDFIEDDGSHQYEHQILTANMLIPLLAPGGIYAIEDIHLDKREIVQAGVLFKSEIHEIIYDDGSVGNLVLVVRK